MPTTSPAAARAPATLPLFLPQAPADKVSGLFHAATLLAQLLGPGPRARQPRACAPRWRPPSAAPTRKGRGSGRTPTRRSKRRRSCSCANSAAPCAPGRARGAAMLAMLTRLAERLPSQTRRSEESQHFQQFSTPDHARLRRRRGGRADRGRPRPGAVRRHGAAGDLRRARQGAARPQRNRRHPRRAARPPVPRRRAGHQAQRRADPRPSRRRRSGRASC